MDPANPMTVHTSIGRVWSVSEGVADAKSRASRAALLAKRRNRSRLVLDLVSTGWDRYAEVVTRWMRERRHTSLPEFNMKMIISFPIAFIAKF